MPTYKIGGERVRRKHFWLPCIISARTDDMTEAERAAIYKATYWSDNITNAEWPVVLGHEGATKPNRSRLKKKIVGWLMAMGRIARLNPELFEEARQKAAALYRQQLEEDHPFLGAERVFEVEGHSYTWSPGTLSKYVGLPDGGEVLVTFEVGQIVAVEPTFDVAEGSQPA